MKKKAPFHIIHILGNLGPGGAEMGVIRLVENMQDSKFNHQIVVFGDDISLKYTTGTKVSCKSLGLTGPSYLAFWHLRRVLKSAQADLVHVNNLPTWFDAAMAAKLAGCPCIETFHGIEQTRLKFSLAKKTLFKTSARMTAAITAVAAPAADLFSKLTDISREKIMVIPNGIDTDRFSPVKNNEKKKILRKKNGLPLNAILFGCVAALRPVKNHSDLIRAFASASKNVSGAYLILAGEGRLEKELHRLTGELRMEDRILFLGPRQDVPDLLKCFDVFILNSETEGLSYSVLEAMASGLPVIATSVGANPQLVCDGEQGFLVPSGDSHSLESIIVHMIEHIEHSAIMGKNARNRVVSEYSQETMLKKYKELYHKVITEK